MNPETLAETSSLYTEHPNAQKPPFVLTGGHIAAMTFWHGELMNDWANRWVSYWSDGATDFVTSAMEDTGTYQALYYLDKINKVDVDRFFGLARWQQLHHATPWRERCGKPAERE